MSDLPGILRLPDYFEFVATMILFSLSFLLLKVIAISWIATMKRRFHNDQKRGLLAKIARGQRQTWNAAHGTGNDEPGSLWWHPLLIIIIRNDLRLVFIVETL